MTFSCSSQGSASAVTRHSRVMPGGNSGASKKRKSQKPVTVSQGKACLELSSMASRLRQTGRRGASDPRQLPCCAPCRASVLSAKCEKWQPPWNRVAVERYAGCSSGNTSGNLNGFSLMMSRMDGSSQTTWPSMAPGRTQSTCSAVPQRISRASMSPHSSRLALSGPCSMRIARTATP